MTVEGVERRLAAILAADVVGYSRLTGLDEEGTLARLRSLQAELIAPLVEKHRGRIVKTMGDGFLVEFASVLDAVRSAVRIQRGAAARNATIDSERRIEYRIGIHIGDVMVQPDGDVLGDSVNIAARLESIAEGGGICLSEDAFRQVRDRIKAEFRDLGEKRLKNIERPIRVYAAKSLSQPASAARNGRGEKKAPPRGRPDALKLPAAVRVRGPGLRLTLATVDDAIKLIDRNLPHELASLPRWTFARALLLEALRTGKSRDLNAAARQLTQALGNERWLDKE